MRIPKDRGLLDLPPEAFINEMNPLISEFPRRIILSPVARLCFASSAPSANRWRSPGQIRKVFGVLDSSGAFRACVQSCHKISIVWMRAKRSGGEPLQGHFVIRSIVASPIQAIVRRRGCDRIVAGKPFFIRYRVAKKGYLVRACAFFSPPHRPNESMGEPQTPLIGRLIQW